MNPLFISAIDLTAFNVSQLLGAAESIIVPGLAVTALFLLGKIFFKTANRLF